MKCLLIILVALFRAGVDAKYKGTYTFFRSLDKKAEEYGTRRVFGGDLAEIAEFPNICVLSDFRKKIKCSCSIVAARWALTAAHCVTGKLKYINYNTRMPSDRVGDTATLVQGYIHPDYKVIQQDEGRGMDVTNLYHDIGMVKTDSDMVLSIPLDDDPLLMMRKPLNHIGKQVKVMGFGKTESFEGVRSHGEQLFSVVLRSRRCDRSTWIPCICGVTDPGFRTRGVCSGDSGGPVILDGVQLALTSMGPVECVTQTDPTPGATSVFTAVHDYVDIINDTIQNRFGKLTMQPVAVGLGGCCALRINHAFSLVLVLLYFLQ